MGVVLLAPFGVACASAATAPANQQSIAPAISVRATDFAFTPSTVRVPVGKPVRIQITDGGIVEHDLRVDLIPVTGVRASEHEAGSGHGGPMQVMTHTLPGKTGWVEFTLTKTGTFDMVCTITGHKDAGMKGTLIIE